MALMQKLYKIPDKTIFRLIFASIILWNLKYFFLIFQIPFTMFFVPYLEKNAFYSQISDIKNSISDIQDFQDEGKTGFVSDTAEANVFDLVDSIRDFYTTQYAIVPSILKNDTKKNYVIGVFVKKEKTPDGFSVVKKINDKTYLYKRINE